MQSSRSLANTSHLKAKRKLKEVALSLRFPLLLFLCVLVLFLVHQHLFLIREISCSSTEGGCQSELTHHLNQYKGKSLLWLNQEKILTDLKNTGLIDNAVVNFGLPAKMKIQVQSITERFPILIIVSDQIPSLPALVSTQSAGIRLVPDLELYMASQSGNTYQLLSTGVLSSGEPTDNGLAYIGTSLPNKDAGVQIFNWLKAISFAKINFKSTYFYENLIVADDITWDVVYDLDDEPTDGLFALQQLRPVATIREPKVIDFRFKHPILK